jgi:predicted AAA+ superfamily ATPase
VNEIRPRWFLQNLQSALRVLPVVVLTGARQTGKTTLSKGLGLSRAYLTLDDMGLLEQAGRNPDSLLATRPVSLDEVQRAPGLLLAVKRAVDEQRRAGGLFGASSVLSRRVAGAGGRLNAAGPPVRRRL